MARPSRLLVHPLFFFWLLFCGHIHFASFITSASKNGIMSPEEVIFPPHFVPSNDPDRPAGHLKIFGLQRPPNGPVIEYSSVLKPQEFWDKHVKQNQPLVFRQAIADSPAIKKWTDSYLKEKYGDLDVLTELKEENRTHGVTGRMLLGDFIDTYTKKNLYVVTVLPDPMRQDLPILACIMCGSFKDFLHELNLWISSGGTRSVIHFDADHNIHCLVAGRKDFMMIDPIFSKHMNVTRPPQFGSGFSMVNPDVVDLNQFPDIPKVEWRYSTLEPGDCIYIPSGYIHQVRSYKGNRTISATMLFTASLDGSFDNSSCENETYEYRSLSEAKVHWTYNKGDKTIDMGYQNIERFRETLLELFQGKDRINEQIFTKMIENEFELDEEDVQAIQRDTTQVYREFLDPKGKGYITQDDIKALSQDALKKVLRQCEAPHGPVAGSEDDQGGANKFRTAGRKSIEEDNDERQTEEVKKDEL